ncbi:mycofactocin system transcriptional regulator [Saccharopolyspora antimicrobica]|uniref:mycofactocin system transcriptional regulator n=1 Tax=Saccharopolyspora antimicrobica TaxID=455193 RepID=UPI0034E963D6
MGSNTVGATARSRGRRRVTSAAELEQVAFDLFDEQGFENTTVTDIARAAGIARRTFFHYFPSKNDVPWGDFGAELARLRADLHAAPSGIPLMDNIRHCLVEFNRVPSEQVPAHRRRMRLILGVPALQAHSTLRFHSWREVIAEFVGERTGQPAGALAPQTIAHATLGVALAAYERWLDQPDAELTELLDAAMRELAAAFSGAGPARRERPASTGTRHQEAGMPTGESAVQTEFTPRIGKVARRELAVHGFTRYAQLTDVTPADLLKIHGVGPKAIRILGEELAEQGLSFADS